jgi:putative membrane protein
MNSISESKLKKIKIGIRIASISIPLVIALLFRVKIKGVDFSFLPPIYATINAITSILLVLALYFIKIGNRLLHQ